MIDLSQKIKEFAIQAIAAENLAKYGDSEVTDIQKLLMDDLHQLFVEFAKLVAKDCAMIAYQTGDDGDCYANSILYEYDVDNCRSQK